MRPAAVHLWLAALGCIAPFAAIAHEGPEHEIEELTERMNKTGVTADLLSERAVEYRVLGKIPEATKDLERAAALAPGSVGIQRELARVLFLGGKPSDAMATVARGLALKTEEPADIASLRMLRAEILLSQNENRKALEDCDAALKLHRQNPEWYLMRSDIQRRLKAHKERVAGLDEGIAETGAGVLGIERVEALIDAGQFAAALKVIEPELQDSRIKSSWLIRRARAFNGLGKTSEAGADLKVALEEIGARLNPKRPYPLTPR
jgi:predicted Zn-dependent protease